MVNRANGTRANGHRANGIRADVVAPSKIVASNHFPYLNYHSPFFQKVI